MTAAVDRVLPAGPATAARHPLFIATGAVVAAGTMLMFGMLAVWFKFRDASPLRVGKNNKMIHDWLPADLKIPEVATNTLAITMVIAAIMGQWAVYSAARKDAQHTTHKLRFTSRWAQCLPTVLIKQCFTQLPEQCLCSFALALRSRL
jgi:hypothetical protein